MKEGWEYKKIDDICTIVGRIGFRGYTKNDLVSKPELGAITLSPSNIINGELSFKKCSYISLKKYEESPEIMLAEGDVVLVKTASIGKCAIVRNLPHKATLNPQFVVFKNIKLDNEYFNYYIKSPHFQKSLKTIVGGVAIPTLSQKKLGQLELYFPTLLEEQRRIVSYLDSSFQLIDEIKEKAQKSLSEAKALFQSALAEAMEPKEGTLMRKIGDVFTTYAGGTPLKSQKDYYEGGDIPWLRSGEVCKKYISETEMYITQKGMDNSSAKFYPDNTVVVAMYGATAAQVGILKIKATSNQAVCGIIPHKDFIPEYVYYWFLFVQDDLASQAQGGAQPNISQIKIKNVLIPILKKEEQHQIVSHLDKLSSNVKQMEEKYKKIVDECDALKQAMLRDVFE